MSKGAVVAVVVVGAVVVLGGGAIAFAARRKDAPSYVPLQPPPPPSLGQDVAIVGSAVLYEGGKFLSEIGNNEIVQTIKNNDGTVTYVVRNVLTGGLYSVGAGAAGVGKKIWNAIF